MASALIPIEIATGRDAPVRDAAAFSPLSGEAAKAVAGLTAGAL